MFALRCCSLVVGIALFVVAGRMMAQEAAAQETAPAGSEKAYLDLRQSENRVTKLSAERYYNLIRQQEWSSQDGKSKVLAKYVAHDPNFKWVKLATVRGSGENRVTREVTVPLEKLSKACQSRVRRIAFLQPKLDELVAAEPEMGAAGADGAGSEYGRGSRGSMRGERGGYSGGRGGYDATATESTGEDAAANDVATDESSSAAGGYSGYNSAGSESGGVSAADTGANDPDPLGFGELANEPPLEATAGYGAVLPGGSGIPGAESSGPRGEQAPTGSADRSQWASSYEAFLANFTASTNERGVPSLEWGGLADLRAMNEAAVEHARDSSADPYRSKIAEIANRLGEVRWQGSFAGVEAQESGGPVVRFNLPPLPEPLKIRFLADESEASMFSEMQRGQQVQFAGRFDIKTPNEIDVYIHVAN